MPLKIRMTFTIAKCMVAQNQNTGVIMAISLAEGQMFKGLFGDNELSVLFSDSAEVRAMLLVEGALAAAQGKLGTIPQESGEIINRMAREVLIDPGHLAAGVARDGVVVPALVAAFATEMQAPEHSAYLHKGATSQDIIDTALVLRLRRVLDILDARLAVLLDTLAKQAETHKTTPMGARTRHQIATPTALGARIASWGAPFLRHRQRLAELRPRVLVVSLAGASGNLSAFEGRGLETADALAKELGLGRAELPWHSARDGICELANLCGLICGSLGKIAQDLLLSAQIGDGLRAGVGGGSSTMPHKANPTGAEAMLALARQGQGLAAQVAGAAFHAQERDGAAWSQEWLSLPSLIVATGAALCHGLDLAGSLDVEQDKLASVFEETNGLMMAEAASFALAEHMPLADARALTKSACAKSVQSGEPLRTVMARETVLAIDWDRVFDARSALGESEAIVSRFCDLVARQRPEKT
ncbi:class-II fumarase/aspartase family protein [Neptunicoccus cionae]|nr:adenylosuccinate lyase family protein [Amylibacter cionae]